MRLSSKIQWIRQIAHSLGFCRVGIAPAWPLPRLGGFRSWLSEGRSGCLEYLAREPEQRYDPRSLLPEAQSAVVVAAAYPPSIEPGVVEPSTERGPTGRVARFARGPDYHRVLYASLMSLGRRLQERLGPGEPVLFRPAVDTSPLAERELACAAGLGFFGKNTMLISPGVGSFTVLGVLLLSLPLEPDPPMAARCGTCRRCLDACPTGALVAPYTLDARRCLACLTVEDRGPVPRDLSSKVYPWVFGCDVCQEVCPYNARAPRRARIHPGLVPGPDAVAASGAISLPWLLGLRAGDYRRLTRGRTLRRADRGMLARNAALAVGCAPGPMQPEVREALERLAQGPHQAAAQAAQWALYEGGRSCEIPPVGRVD